MRAQCDAVGGSSTSMRAMAACSQVAPPQTGLGPTLPFDEVHSGNELDDSVVSLNSIKAGLQQQKQHRRRGMAASGSQPDEAVPCAVLCSANSRRQQASHTQAEAAWLSTKQQAQFLTSGMDAGCQPGSHSDGQRGAFGFLVATQRCQNEEARGTKKQLNMPTQRFSRTQC